MFDAGAVRLNDTSPIILLDGSDKAPIVGAGFVTVNIAVVDSDVYIDAAACVAVIVLAPFPTTFTS